MIKNTQVKCTSSKVDWYKAGEMHRVDANGCLYDFDGIKRDAMLSQRVLRGETNTATFVMVEE